MQHSCSVINVFLHCMYNAQMYAAIACWQFSKAFSKRSVLGLACESTFCLAYSHAACFSVCPGSACCPCCPLILWKSFFEPRKPRGNRTLTSPSSQKLSMNMVNHVGAPGVVKVTNHLLLHARPVRPSKNSHGWESGTDSHGWESGTAIAAWPWAEPCVYIIWLTKDYHSQGALKVFLLAVFFLIFMLNKES